MQPNRHRLALLVWIFVYPVVTLIFVVLGPWMARLPLLLRTLVMSGIMVVLMTYLIIPAIVKWFHGWLFSLSKSPGESAAQQETPAHYEIEKENRNA